MLTAGLDDAALARLDALFDARPTGKLTWLGWLRNAPQSPAVKNVPRLLDRLDHVRTLRIDRGRARGLPLAVLEQRSDEANRIAAQHLAGLHPLRRRAVLAAAAIGLEEGLTDAALLMFEKLMTSLGRSAARKTDERAARSTREIQGDLRVFVLTGRLLQAFAFEGSGAVKELMAALDVIRATYASGLRKLLASPPIRFVPRRWRPFVLTKAGVDRAGYELCAFSELRERLRAGDVWVAKSRRYRAFDDDLLPRPTFEALKTTGPLPLAVAPRFEDHIASAALAWKRPPHRWQHAPGPAICPTCGWTGRG